MKVCNNCQKEYDDNTVRCPACGYEETEVILVQEEFKLTHLTTVNNEIEYELIAGLLSNANIPVFKDHSGVDGFAVDILGLKINGLKVLVPVENYDKALQIISSHIDYEELKKEELQTEGDKNPDL
jgi:hypothetical protein